MSISKSKCRDLLRKENEDFDSWVRRLQQTPEGNKKLAAMFGPRKGGFL